MDAVDIKNRLSSEFFVFLHRVETCFQFSTLDTENSEICYYSFKTIPNHRSYGVVRKFSSLEEASKHYESLLDNPDPTYVLKPDGPLARKNEEDHVYMVRYSRVFEVFNHWTSNFQSKNRSDDDIYRISRKVGPALASRYKRTGSLGHIFKDTVITDDEQVLFWNWAPDQSKEYRREIRELRYYVKQMKTLATNPGRFDQFETFLDTHVLQHPAPHKELIMWLFHYPVFMTEAGGVRFVEALNKITSDVRTGVKVHPHFTAALRSFDKNWQSAVTGSSDDALKAVLNYPKARKYKTAGTDLPRFAHNCVKHYSENAAKLGMHELTQIQVVDMLNTKYFKNFLEASFQGLYQCMEVLPSPFYNSEQILDMMRGGKRL